MNRATRGVGWTAALLLLLATACGRHDPQTPDTPGGLRLAVQVAPRAPGAPVVGAVDTIQVDLREPGVATPRTARVAVAAGARQFSVSLAATAGAGRSLSVLAIGSRPVSSGPAGPETARGVLHFARADSIEVLADATTTVPVVLALFVPEIARSPVLPGSPTHTIRWTRIPGAHHYRLTRIDGNGARSESTVTDTAYVGNALPMTYQVAAVESGGRRGAPSDYVQVSALPPPPAPSNLAAAAVSTTAIDITWRDNSTDETGFELQRRLPPADFAALAAPAADAVRYGDSGLEPNTAYGYRLRAVSAAGVSDWTAAATGTTMAEAPVLTATSVSASRIDLGWTLRGTATSSFDLERRRPPGAFGPLASPGAGETAHVDSGLAGDTTYEYRIRIRNVAGVSDWSNVAAATTGITPPAAPSGLEITREDPDRIDLAWTDNSTNETGFELQRAVNRGPFARRAIVGAGVTAFADTEVVENTVYAYRVLAFNSAGPSGWSNTAQGSTPLGPPGTPGNLTATALASSEIRLRWRTSQGTVLFYDIFRRTPPAGATFDSVTSVAAPDTTYLDNRLVENTSYEYRVRARNGAGQSGYSNLASATTLLEPPSPPSNLQITLLAASQVDLQWMDNSTNEAGFEVERATGEGGFQPLGTVAAGSTAYSDTKVAASTPYRWRVRSVNAAGPSTWSDEVAGTTPPAPPGAPSGLVAAAISISEIRLTWHPATGVVDSYDILRGAPGGPLGFAGTVAAAETTYTDRSLPENTTFEYRVRARNTAGVSELSNAAQATTGLSPPAAPTGLFITSASTAGITMIWNDHSNNEDGFEIDKKAVMAAAAHDSVGPGVTSYTDEGPIARGGTYTYQVRAFNAAGVSGWSNEVSVYLPYAKPGPPTSLGASVLGPNAIRLGWATGTGYITYYEIWRRTLPGGPDAYLIVFPAVTTYDDLTLPVAAYEYRVRAGNPDSTSAWSAPADASLITPPAEPGTLDAAYEGGAIEVHWIDASSNEDGFVLERRADAGAFTPLVTLPAGTVFYRDEAVACDHAYAYRVYAYNSAGASGYSNESPTVPMGPCAEGGMGRAGPR